MKVDPEDNGLAATAKRKFSAINFHALRKLYSTRPVKRIVSREQLAAEPEQSRDPVAEFYEARFGLVVELAIA